MRDEIVSYYAGMPVYEHNFPEFVQVRRHKKKRINKKWLKRYGTRLVNGKNRCMVFTDEFGAKKMICSPDVMDKLRDNIEVHPKYKISDAVWRLTHV